LLEEALALVVREDAAGAGDGGDDDPAQGRDGDGEAGDSEPAAAGARRSGRAGLSRVGLGGVQLLHESSLQS
jgi:hypothetical protein